MSELQVFNFEELPVRTLTMDDEPYFVGKDVAEVLGYSNTRDALNKHVDEDDKKILTSRNTTLENLFSALYPNLKKQVHFGTGKGGYEKYLSKRYTVDFYDEEKDVIYEIDGSNHNTELQKIKDKIRDYFFWHELDIKTIRLTNKAVENIAWERLCTLNEEGKLSE